MKQLNEQMQLANRSPTCPMPIRKRVSFMAARLQMARSRQQLLSSMVILGINRIVVTDGAINAKVVFDFRASDEAAAQGARVAARHGFELQQEHHRCRCELRLGRRRDCQHQHSAAHDDCVLLGS